ncbi:DUF2089 family protein [Haloimpatiens sp. FM7330]|uniref:DUF2089 family protein n=1 Tax=Haloimpatiens sp. FM7330 TaxID=3298610 RepID=UPI00363BA643
MENKLYCPRCNNKLIATRLTYDKCDIELMGNFELSKFDYLSSKDINFIILFLTHQDNLKAIQKDTGISYTEVKKKLGDIFTNLGIDPSKEEERGGFRNG